MKVLVLGSSGKSAVSLYRRRLIVTNLSDFRVELLNPAPGRPPQTPPPPPLFPQLFYQPEEKLLEKADLVIADLTESDFKTGFLVSKALGQQKPVLGLFWQEKETKMPSFDEDWQKKEQFFWESFNEQNIRSLLRHFLSFCRKRKRFWGRLIAIEGVDGSGKSTQARRLFAYFKKRGLTAKIVDFPRYETSFYGQMAGRFLQGEFGSPLEISPYLASLPYALDRFKASSQIEDWLKGGCFVIANRYAPSNLAYQGARLKGKEQEKFWDWAEQMEYQVNKIPREDAVVFLHLPARVSQKLVLRRSKKTGKQRDKYEKNLVYLEAVEKAYLKLAKRFPYWLMIECLSRSGDKILPPAEIEKKIIQGLEERGVIK
ncbi:hypothetical protein KBI33_01315 [Candidatus Shapirobacteria bacterium]|nr:hypothetical protein [Candidatus Shapirobacteria bacterium]